MATIKPLPLCLSCHSEMKPDYVYRVWRCKCGCIYPEMQVAKDARFYPVDVRRVQPESNVENGPI